MDQIAVLKILKINILKAERDFRAHKPIKLNTRLSDVNYSITLNYNRALI